MGIIRELKEFKYITISFHFAQNSTYQGCNRKEGDEVLVGYHIGIWVVILAEVKALLKI